MSPQPLLDPEEAVVVTSEEGCRVITNLFEERSEVPTELSVEDVLQIVLLQLSGNQIVVAKTTGHVGVLSESARQTGVLVEST